LQRVRGQKNYQRDTSGEPIAAARTLHEQSIAADPRYAPALQGLALTYVMSWLNRQQYEPIAREYQEQATIDRALCLAQNAVELDGNLPDAHVTLAVWTDDARDTRPISSVTDTCPAWKL
jgi:hypothetical protein